MVRSLLLFAFSLAAFAQWQKGDLVRVRNEYSTWYAAEILAISGATYTVKWTEWIAAPFQVDASRIREHERGPRRLTAPAAQPAAPPATPPAAQPVPGGTTLSKADILNFLRARIGTDPWNHPQKAATIRELAELIRQRGVNFRWVTLESTEFINAGANESTIPFHIQANYGPPATQAWLQGIWDMYITGATTTFERNGSLYRRMEQGALGGSVAILPNNTYAWKLAPNDPPEKYIRGTWRPATPAEMAVSYQGGAGVVLLNAYTGADWIVMKRSDEGQRGDGVTIAQLHTRATRQLGTRRQ